MTATPRRRPVLSALVGAVLAAVLLVTTGPAPVAQAGNFPGQSTQGSASGRVGRCVATAGPNYLGLACPGGRKGTGDPLFPPHFLCKGVPKFVDVKEVPAQTPKSTDPASPAPCQPAPDCWNDKLTDEELRATDQTNTEGPDGVTWYWKRCLEGINKDTLAVQGEVNVGQSLLPFGNSDIVKPVALTGPQRELIDYYFDPPAVGGNRPPDPLPQTSPAIQPRVRTNVSFVDGNQTGTTVTVRVGRAQLMAVENYVEVQPKGEGSSATTSPDRCRRAGSTDPNDAGFEENASVGREAKAGDTPENTEGGCWYRYDVSSYDEPDEAYQVGAQARWSVWKKDGDGPWERFTSSFSGQEVDFEKVATPSPLVVSEVQAINVLPNGEFS